MNVKRIQEANELETRSKKHKKNNKGLSFYCTLNPDAGDVEHNVAMFNHMNTPAESPSVNPCGPMAEDINLREESIMSSQIELNYDDLEVTIVTRPQRPSSYHFEYDRDEAQTVEEKIDYEFVVAKSEIVDFLYENMTENDFADIDTAPEAEVLEFINKNFDALFAKYESMILDAYRDQAREDAEQHMNESLTEKELGEVTCGVEKFVSRLGEDLHEAFLSKTVDNNTAEELLKLEALYEKYSRVHDTAHMNKIVEKVKSAIASCADAVKPLTESFNEYVIMAICNDGKKQYYNVSAVPHWMDKGSEATIFDDMDEARAIWFKIDKKPFKRVLIPNYDHEKMNEAVAPDQIYTQDLLLDRIEDLIDFGLKGYPARSVGTHAYRVNNKNGNASVIVNFDVEDFSKRFVFTVDGEKRSADSETEAANIIKKAVDMKYSKSFDLTVEDLSDKIRTNDLEYDDTLDAWTASQGNVEVQFQDREQCTHEFRTKKNQWGRSYVDGQYNKQPKVASHTWGRVWKDGKLVKQSEGPKYQVRADIAKYLDAEGKLDEAKVPDSWKQYRGAWIYPVYGGWEANLDGLHYDAETEDALKAKIDSAVRGGYTKDNKLAGLHRDADRLPPYGGMLDEAWHPDYTDCPVCGDISFDPKRGRCTQCAYREELTEANYGGAYDIDPEQYFTRDDLVEFADEITSCIAAREDVLFDVCELYIEGNNITLGLNNAERNGDFEHYVTFRVDMRKIRYPHDLSKYVSDISNEFIREYKAQCGEVVAESVEDVACDWEYRTADGRWIIRQAENDHRTPKKLTRTQAQEIADFRGYQGGELRPLKESTDNEYNYKGYTIVFANNGECSVIDSQGKHLRGNMVDAEAREFVDSLTESFLDDDDNYEFISSKSVLDSDGFYTDYTWYKNQDGLNVFVFGDSDIYKPEDGYIDHEEEDDSAAQEWFDSYNGFEEDIVDENLDTRNDVFCIDDQLEWTDLSGVKFRALVTDVNDDVVVLDMMPVGGTPVTKTFELTCDSNGKECIIAAMASDKSDAVYVYPPHEDLEESTASNKVVYPNGEPVTDVDLDRALDYMYGTDRNPEWTYTDAEMQRAIYYWMDKTDPHPSGKSYMSLQESYNIKFYQIFQAPSKPTETGKMIGQRDTLSAAIDFGEDRCGPGKFFIKGVCDDGRTRYVDFFRKARGYVPFANYKDDVTESFEDDGPVYVASSTDSLNNYSAGLGDACKKLRDGNMCSYRDYEVEFVDGEYNVYLLESLDESKENRPLYIIKDSHGNQLSAPNSDDEELWDRVASMEARGRRGLCVVAYTGKKESLKEWNEFSDDDVEDDLTHAAVYGGDSKYCKECGAVKKYDEDGFAYCPECCGESELVVESTEDDGKTVSVSFDVNVPKDMTESQLEDLIRKALGSTDAFINSYMEVHTLDESLNEKLTGYKLTIKQGEETFDDYACSYEEAGAIQQMKNKYGDDIEIVSVDGSRVIRESYWFNDPELRSKQDSLIVELEADGWEETDGVAHGSKHWTFFRKRIDGKGHWKAIFVDTSTNEAHIQDVTYEQVRGYAPLDSMDALRKHLGNTLLP